MSFKHRYLIKFSVAAVLMIVAFYCPLSFAENAPAGNDLPVIGKAQKKLFNIKKQTEATRQTSSDISYKFDVKVSPDQKTILHSPALIKTRKHGKLSAYTNAKIRTQHVIKARQEDKERKYDVRVLPGATGKPREKAGTRRHGEKDSDPNTSLIMTIPSFQVIDKVNIKTRAWKLDASGNRTNEEIIGGLKWIKRTYQPPETEKE